MSRHFWWGPLAILVVGLFLLGGKEDPPATVARGADARIVSLAPSLTEIIIALGAGERLIGVTAYCQDVPPDVQRFGGLEFDVEKILDLEPDLVLAIETEYQRRLLEVLTRQGVAVETQRAESIEDILTSLDLLGGRFDARERAADLRAEIERSLTPSPESPIPVLFVVERSSRTVAGGGSFVNAMLHAAGMVNVFGEESWPYRAVEFEAIVDHDPVLILDASSGESDPLEYWSRFQRLQAVRENAIRPFPPVLPGLKIPDWIELLKAEARDRRP